MNVLSAKCHIKQRHVMLIWLLVGHQCSRRLDRSSGCVAEPRGDVGGLSEIDGADRRHAILILVAHPPRDDDPGKPGM